MFYYRIDKRTRAIPRVESTTYDQVGQPRHIADRVQAILAGGEYGKVTVEAISQAAYVRATRSGE